MEAAVCASHGAMSSLLWKLGTLLSDEYKLLTGVKADIMFLKAELESIHAFLKKMSEVEDPDEQSKCWMEEVRELSYDIEDSIDNFMASLGSDSSCKPRIFKGFIGKCIDILTNGKTRHQIAKKIQCHKCHVIEASNRRMRYKVDDAVSRLCKISIDPRLPAFYTDMTRLVGIDGPRDNLIKLLAEGDGVMALLKVVSIVGLGGLGKTTAANEVYQKLEGHFEYRAFVSVSQKPDMKNILRKILCQLIWQDCGNNEAWDEQQIINTIRQFLKDKRRIFGSEDRCPHHLKEVSNDILKKCSGLPLAIITVASLLATKTSTKEEWERVAKSIGSALEKDMDTEEMRKILSLSYNDLPYHLKTCLLYLSIFPEDYEIKRDRLVKRWIAEGFINVEGGKDMEHIGECYFNDLINRSMIQPVRIQYDGRPDACRVHDMILDLIESKSVQENFVTLSSDLDHELVQQSKVRRLSLNYYACEDIMVPTNMTVSNARSLTIFGYAENMPCLSNFHLLRVLDLENRVILEDNYLKHINRLSQLTYLRLDSRKITALPEQLGDLQKLQTLDLRWTRIKRLPASIVRLQWLQCLLINSIELPEGIRNMQALRELSEIEINCATSVSSLQELGSLTNLKVLGLNWCIVDTDCVAETYADNLVMSLSKLGMLNLQSIHIQSFYSCSLDFLLDSWFPPPYFLQKFEMSIDYFFPRIPNWIHSLEYLTYLDIYVSPVDDESFCIIGDLPALLFLWMSSRDTKSKDLIIRSTDFRCLKEFYLTCWGIGTGITFEAGAMPMLEKLRIPFNAHGACSLNSGLDFGIQHLSSLKHLYVEIVCDGAKVHEVEALEIAVRNASDFLSNDGMKLRS